MENFIFSYLTEHFYLRKSHVGNWGIHLGPEDPDKDYTGIYRGHKLVSEISMIFGISEKQAKRLINKWAKPIDLKFYWKVGIDLSSIDFPNVNRVFSTLVAQDIVDVRPMTPPNPTFMFLGLERITTTTLQEAYDNSTQPMIYTYVESGKTK
jgi:hypothetical protein